MKGEKAPARQVPKYVLTSLVARRLPISNIRGISHFKCQHTLTAMRPS